MSDETSASKRPVTDPGDDWVAVGEVVGVFGVQGGLKIRPLTDFPERFHHTDVLYVGEKRQPFEVISATEHGRNLVLRLAGIDNPEAGSRWRGAYLYVPGAEITPLSGDQHYIHEVIGLRVCDEDGTPLGVVTDVISNDANDLYVVRNDTTGAETLLPAVKEFVKVVDVEAGKIVVTPIPGLFDANSETAG